MASDPATEIASVLAGCRRIEEMLPIFAPGSLEVVRSANIDERDLLRQVLLHLPLRTEIERAGRETVFDTATRCADALVQARCHGDCLPVEPPRVPVALEETEFREIDQNSASLLIERYHYLRSPRTDAQAYGLFVRTNDHTSAVALATLSPFDLNTVRPALQRDIHPSEVLVVSRVLAFPNTPRNAISFLFARLSAQLRLASPTRLLVSYINPNVGFNGASLRSSGWWKVAYEVKPYYLYLDGRYVTERFCLKGYGTSEFTKLREPLGERIQRSIGRLAPLILYGVHLYDNEQFRQARSSPPLVDSPFRH